MGLQVQFVTCWRKKAQALRSSCTQTDPGWPEQRPALGQVEEAMLNPRELRAGTGARSTEFTASGVFRKLFPGVAAAEAVLLPLPPARAQFFCSVRA